MNLFPNLAIVDGEQSWKAAKDGDLKLVPCEIIDVNKFEAMRQTIVRNRHGDNNPVLLGRLFEKMLKVGKLSNRELAKNLDISEGTVRVHLQYTNAEKLRNDYAPKESLDKISGLHVKQIEAYLRLPAEKRDDWLDSGGRLEEAAKLMPAKPSAEKAAAASTASKAAPTVPDVDDEIGMDNDEDASLEDDSDADGVSDAESSADEGAETTADDGDGDANEDQDDSSSADAGEDGDSDTPVEPVAPAFDKKVLKELEDAWDHANEATRQKFLAGIMADAPMLKYIRQLFRQGA